MEEYRMEYDQDYQFENDGQDGLQHYRMQIAKLEEKLRDDAATYKKRIAELEGELYLNRRPLVSSSQRQPVKLQENLSYELYEKDLQIRELKAENVKLRQIINNPDKVLIRKPDYFEAIAEKEQEIIKLRKTIQELQGRHDGQYLSEHKLKKENEMLVHEVEKLRLELRQQSKWRFGMNQETVDPELLEALRYKELESCKQELKVLQNAIKAKEEELLAWRNKFANSRLGLGMGTQYEEMRLELNEYRDKNRELNKLVTSLQEENERLYTQRDRARIAAEQRMPEVARKSPNETERTENLARYHQNRSIAMKSLVPPPQQVPTVMRKTKRYEQFHFSDWESIAQK